MLAVLERRSDAPARVRLLGGDARLEVPDGRLSLSSPVGVDIVSGEQLRLVSRELDVVADEGRLTVANLVARTKTLLARSGAVDAAFDVLETAAERVTSRVKRSYRFVEDADVTRAGSIDTRAKESFVMRAKDALVNAKRLVRLDGEQIHLG